MNEERTMLGERPRTLSAYRILASIGIGVLLDSETVYNYSDDLDTRRALEISNELYLFSTVLAALCTQHEHSLKTLEVVLPEEVGAVVVQNPLYQSKTKEPSADADGSISGTGDDFPF